VDVDVDVDVDADDPPAQEQSRNALNQRVTREHIQRADVATATVRSMLRMAA
jgi:hypothetical protein